MQEKFHNSSMFLSVFGINKIRVKIIVEVESLYWIHCCVCVGDLTKEEELLSWLIHQKRHSEIADITDEILDKLIDSVDYLAVLFC